jgi:hypothetical protein
MGSEEEELWKQLRDLSCFFCVREPRLSPAEVRAILDDARTTGLHPPGDALSADDWAQLTQELEEDYSVGSFEAEVEANPLPAGQQYVLDVFGRIDGIVGAGRGTLSLGEMVKAVGLDEGLRLALGMGAELLGGEEHLAEVHGISSNGWKNGTLPLPAS